MLRWSNGFAHSVVAACLFAAGIGLAWMPGCGAARQWETRHHKAIPTGPHVTFLVGRERRGSVANDAGHVKTTVEKLEAHQLPRRQSSFGFKWPSIFDSHKAT